MTWVRNLRLPDGRALTVAATVVDPDEHDLRWAELTATAQSAWREFAAAAGVDTTGWDA